MPHARVLLTFSTADEMRAITNAIDAALPNTWRKTDISENQVAYDLPTTGAIGDANDQMIPIVQKAKAEAGVPNASVEVSSGLGPGDDRDEQRHDLLATWGVALYEDWGERALAWLKEKWGDDHPCPHCRTNVWNVGAKLVELNPWGSTSVLPMLQVTCANCGNVVLIDAVLAGLIER
jgi:hypothetical protein